MFINRNKFKLTNYFSTASLLGIVALVAALFFYNRHHALQGFMEHETRSNVALTKAFANTIWPHYAHFVRHSAGMDRAQLLARDEIHLLRTDVLNQMHGLNIAKVKLYNLDGLTVFSTDKNQIGESKSDNKGFLSAAQGEAISHITFRDRFDSFEGVINNRNLVSSYIPVRRDANLPVEGVLEVYSDVTPLVAGLERAQWRIALGLTTGLLVFYLFLLFIVQRADRILQAQAQERASSEERIRYQAYHDILTELPNRISFAERLDEVIKLSHRANRMFALLFLDLDRFKVVNDSLGHDAGDQLLQIASKRIRSGVREGDLVFRMGGDEFTILLEDIQDTAESAHIAQRIIDNMAKPIRLREHELLVSASIGISVYPTDATVSEKLIKNADTAMYLAKASGRNRYIFFTSEMNRRAMERFHLEAGLQYALQRDEFVLHYQPRVAADSGKIVAVEALLRWKHPKLGMLNPEQFIDILEDTGMIVPVGEWVLRTACRQLKNWQKRSYAPLRISVNISARQLQAGGLEELIRTVLSDTGLAPHWLELEITETLLTQQIITATELLEAIQKIGILLSLDDFGAGYSSLNYLKYLPLDFLKLDRTLVQELPGNPKNKAIVTALASLARALDINLVAEGVETQDQADYLSTQNCREMQGFLFGRPMSAEDVEAHFLSCRSINAA